MPQLTRHYCSRCQVAIYNTFVDANGKRANEGDPGAVRVPLVFYLVVGQPADTGELDVNGPGVRLPSFVREIMQPHVPVPRAELCMNCVGDVFGLPLVSAQEDPLYSAEQAELTGRTVAAVAGDKTIPHVEKAAVTMDRVFLGIQVGRGAAQAPPLPPAKKRHEPAPAAAPE